MSQPSEHESPQPKTVSEEPDDRPLPRETTSDTTTTQTVNDFEQKTDGFD